MDIKEGIGRGNLGQIDRRMAQKCNTAKDPGVGLRLSRGVEVSIGLRLTVLLLKKKDRSSRPEGIDVDNGISWAVGSRRNVATLQAMVNCFTSGAGKSRCLLLVSIGISRTEIGRPPDDHTISMREAFGSELATVGLISSLDSRCRGDSEEVRVPWRA